MLSELLKYTTQFLSQARHNYDDTPKLNDYHFQPNDFVVFMIRAGPKVGKLGHLSQAPCKIQGPALQIFIQFSQDLRQNQLTRKKKFIITFLSQDRGTSKNQNFHRPARPRASTVNDFLTLNYDVIVFNNSNDILHEKNDILLATQ